MCMETSPFNIAYKMEMHFALEKRNDAKMCRLSLGCISSRLCPCSPADLVCCSLHAHRRRPFRSRPPPPWGFPSRLVLVLPVTVDAMGFHVVQKMVAVVGGADEVHEREGAHAGGFLGCRRDGRRWAVRPRVRHGPCSWSGGSRPL
jgi:hypothetical protein